MLRQPLRASVADVVSIEMKGAQSGRAPIRAIHLVRTDTERDRTISPILKFCLCAAGTRSDAAMPSRRVSGIEDKDMVSMFVPFGYGPAACHR